MALQGKGFYIWQVPRCENGNPVKIADEAVKAGLSHVLVKIADGAGAYNLNASTGEDLARSTTQALKQRGVEVWGWHYVYGYDPIAEANIAVQRIQNTGVQGYVIDAEAQYKNRFSEAQQFMSRLRQSLPVFPMALSSYRYPTYHPQLPWQAFLEKCNFNMPQVYWEQAHNPGEQLIRSLNEFSAMSPFRPMIPTGAAYKAGSWEASSAEVVEFLNTARNLNLNAANFWEWGHTRQYLPHLWDTIASYSWPLGTDNRDILVRYFEALNAHNLDLLASLYQEKAVHVTAERTIQGKPALRAWYTTLFSDTLPNGKFTLGESSGDQSSRTFTWTATSTRGNVTNGYDSIGLVDKKIIYHYTQFSR